MMPRALEAVGMVLNANIVPGETHSPFVTSRIRVGTLVIKQRSLFLIENQRVPRMTPIDSTDPSSCCTDDSDQDALLTQYREVRTEIRELERGI